MLDQFDEHMIEHHPTAGYTISPDGKSITCGTCGMTSYNFNDVENKFCGHCHRFHGAAEVPS